MIGLCVLTFVLKTEVLNMFVLYQLCFYRFMSSVLTIIPDAAYVRRKLGLVCRICMILLICNLTTLMMCAHNVSLLTRKI